jgi:hypothetical protein
LSDLDSKDNQFAAERALGKYKAEVASYTFWQNTGVLEEKVLKVLQPWYEKFPVRKGPGSRSSGLFVHAGADTMDEAAGGAGEGGSAPMPDGVNLAVDFE